MEIVVRAAHFSNRSYYSLKGVRESIIRYARCNDIDSKMAFRALNALEAPEARGRGGRGIIYCLEQLYDDCSAEDRELLQRCLYYGLCSRVDRPSVKLMVEPTITLGAVKSKLKAVPWSPSENIVLVRRKKAREKKAIPLEDDGSTLEELRIKDQESLLVCMGGSFALTVHDKKTEEDFVIPISSCFETIGDVKEKICEKTGHPPEDQSLSCDRDGLGKEETSLVGWGIVRPYMKEMLKPIDMYIAKLFRDDSSLSLSRHQTPDLV